jgi:hypothetical protein
MKWLDEDIQYLKTNFGKIKASEIACILGRSYDAIHKKAQSLKLVGDKGINRKYSVNDKFFSVLDIKRGYWSGFIAADGCITNNYIKIMLSIVDIDILNQFKKDIEYTGPIYIDKKRKRCSLEFRSKQMINDLNSIWNIRPKKSLVLGPPIQNIGKNNILAYIKGYIDGDGSIYKENKRDYLRISIIGTIQLLTWIKENLNIRSSNIMKNKNVYTLRYSGKYANIIYNELFDIDTFVLKRKWKYHKLDMGNVTV